LESEREVRDVSDPDDIPIEDRGTKEEKEGSIIDRPGPDQIAEGGPY